MNPIEMKERKRSMDPTAEKCPGGEDSEDGEGSLILADCYYRAYRNLSLIARMLGLLYFCRNALPASPVYALFLNYGP